MLDLLEPRQEIMEQVEKVLKKAINYQRKFDRYNHLWQEDRTEFLSQFLLFGRVLTAEEMEAYAADALSESPPTIDNFREQVKHFCNNENQFLVDGRCLSCNLRCVCITDRLL